MLLVVWSVARPWLAYMFNDTGIVRSVVRSITLAFLVSCAVYGTQTLFLSVNRKED